MALYINYLEEVKGIRFTISHRRTFLTTITQAEDALLKANLDEMGIIVEPYLTSNLSNFKISTYSSTNFCYLVKADSFSSIEELKERLLKGFKESVSILPGDMEYVFEYYSYNAEEKLKAYLDARSKKNDEAAMSQNNTLSTIASSSLASFFNNKTSPSAEQGPNQGPTCTFL